MKDYGSSMSYVLVEGMSSLLYLASNDKFREIHCQESHTGALHSINSIFFPGFFMDNVSRLSKLDFVSFHIFCTVALTESLRKSISEQKLSMKNIFCRIWLGSFIKYVTWIKRGIIFERTEKWEGDFHQPLDRTFNPPFNPCDPLYGPLIRVCWNCLINS